MPWIRLNASSQTFGIFFTEAEVDAVLVTADGESKVELTLDELGSAKIGDYWNSATRTFQDETIFTTAQVIAARRSSCVPLLRAAELVPELSVWHAARQDDEDTNQLRSRSYGRWVEANTRVVMGPDSNFSDAIKWFFIWQELNIDPETWYWLHKVGTAINTGDGSDPAWYFNYLNNDRAEWNWWYTIGATVTPNSRSGQRIAGNSNDPDLNVTDDWVAWLRAA